MEEVERTVIELKATVKQLSESNKALLDIVVSSQKENGIWQNKLETLERDQRDDRNKLTELSNKMAKIEITQAEQGKDLKTILATTNELKELFKESSDNQAANARALKMQTTGAVLTAIGSLATTVVSTILFGRK